MLARNHFGVGFLRGLTAATEVFATCSSESLVARMRADWRTLGEDLRAALGAALANISQDVAERPVAENLGSSRPITSIISSHWSGPLPPAAELEMIDQIMPGGADRLLCMAEKEQSHRIEDAKRGQYLGWSLAMGAVVAAVAVSLCHGPWQVSVALVGIPVLGAVHALIQGRREKSGKRSGRWV